LPSNGSSTSQLPRVLREAIFCEFVKGFFH
jgi:hypothetical protein